MRLSVRLHSWFWPGPDRSREGQVIAPPRHDVYVQVRHLVAEAGDIDLVGRQLITKNALHPAQDLQQFKRLWLRQIGQFHDMLSPDQAQQARPIGLVSQYQPPGLRLMQHLTACTFAQRTGRRGREHTAQTSTRSMPPAFAAAT